MWKILLAGIVLLAADIASLVYFGCRCGWIAVLSEVLLTGLLGVLILLWISRGKGPGMKGRALYISILAALLLLVPGFLTDLMALGLLGWLVASPTVIRLRHRG